MLVGTLGAVPHPPVDCTTDSVTRRSHEHRRPEQLRVEFEQGHHGELGTHRQQRGRDQGDKEKRRQPDLGKRKHLQEFEEPSFHLLGS